MSESRHSPQLLPPLAPQSSPQLSEEQRQVVENWGRGMAVMAGAGSGKTTTLVLKCIELLRRNPEARFAAVSFTEKSASDLRAKLSARLPSTPRSRESGPLSGHIVTTIHGLCGSIIRDHPRAAGYDGEEAMLSEPEAALLWEQALEGIWAEDLPDSLRVAVERLLDRESRDSLHELLSRLKSLRSFGVLDRLEGGSVGGLPLGAEPDGDEGALAQVGRYVLERYDRLKRRRGALDFDDLEAGADRVLADPSVRQSYQKKFDLVLVDEFQDTNPVQARIISVFAKPDLSNLCVVGDPKQSIYRFRDADVSVFDEFCSRLPVKLSLTWNFRSRPGIIEFANRVCAPAFEASGMVYEPLSPAREPRDPGEPGPVLKLELSDPADLGAWILSQVSEGEKLEDFALLLRKIRGNEKWLKGLTSAGIPIAVSSGGLFWEDPRVRELTAFLRWWDNPGNSLSGAVFLRAPWMGVPDGVLDRWIREDRTWQRPLFGRSEPGLPPQTEAIRSALKPLRGSGALRPGELLMALLVNESVERELGAPLLGLWHRAEELAGRGLDFHSVVRELSASLEEKRRERDVPPPRNQGQLVVLTLHGSKGLEFPHVILVDFPERPARAASAPLLFWDREKGAFLGIRDEDGERDKKHPLEAQWRALEAQKNVAESKRLFYVALTRAKERLVLVYPKTEEKSSDSEEISPRAEAMASKSPKSAKPARARESAKLPDPLAQDFWRGWIDHGGAEVPGLELVGGKPVRETAVESKRAAKNAEPDGERVGDPRDAAQAGDSRAEARARAPALELKRPRHSVTEWNTLARCPRAYEWTYIRPVIVAEGVAEIGLYTGSKMPSFSEKEMDQRELGSRVHAALERGDYDSLKRLESEVGPERFLAEPIVSWALSEDTMRPMSAAASTGVPRETRPSEARDERRVWTELAFEVPVGDEVLVGSIDRLVRDFADDGPWYSIIDFKVTEKPKSVDALLEAYLPQLELYALAISRLEPEAGGRPDNGMRMDARLINISARTIQTVPVPLADLEEKARSLALHAARIVKGDPGAPRPGPLCRVCEFRAKCPEGRGSRA